MDNTSPNDIVNYLCNRYYALVKHLEEIEDRHKVRMNFASCLHNLFLGDVVNINDGIYDNYVITRMHGTFSFSESSEGGGAQETSFHKAEGVPILAGRQGNNGAGTSIVDHLLRVVVPPAADSLSGAGHGNGRGDTPKASGLLEGKVTDNADPRKMNRVKVRYYFQKKESKSDSEWLPVMVPFSGTKDGGGITMTLEKGERVLVQVENNTAKYVLGSIYTETNLPDLGYKDNVPSTYKVGRKIRAIASGNGHAITFLDKPDNSLLFSKIPGFKTALSILRLKGKDNWMTKAGNFKGGGVVISDGSCLCTLELNADKQAIDIHSDFGTVGISAFTGITVNAPNGDITIKGKNVSIEAGNNLSLKAGTNIRKNYYKRDTLGLGISAAFTSMATSSLSSLFGVDLSKMFDVSYLRSIYEILMRPVEGSLSIQSKRNVLVTAGPGKVTIPSSLLSDRGFLKKGKWTKFSSDKDNLDQKKALATAIRGCLCEVDSCCQAIKEQCGAVKSSINGIKDSFTNLDIRKKNGAEKMIEDSLKGIKGAEKKEKIIENNGLTNESFESWYESYTSLFGTINKYKENLTSYNGLTGKLEKYHKIKISLSLGEKSLFKENAEKGGYDDITTLKDDVKFAEDIKTLKRAVVVAILSSNDLVGVKDPDNKGKEDVLKSGINNWTEMINALEWLEPAAEKDDCKFHVSTLLSGIPDALGLANYDKGTGKWKAFPTFQTLFNYDGASGPRGYDTVSDVNNGNVLISNTAGASLSLKPDTNGWMHHINVTDSDSLRQSIKDLHLE